MRLSLRCSAVASWRRKIELLVARRKLRSVVDLVPLSALYIHVVRIRAGGVDGTQASLKENVTSVVDTNGTRLLQKVAPCRVGAT